MTRDEFHRRHAERYRKVFRREMTLEEAMREHYADWIALGAAREPFSASREAE